MTILSPSYYHTSSTWKKWCSPLRINGHKSLLISHSGRPNNVFLIMLVCIMHESWNDLDIELSVLFSCFMEWKVVKIVLNIFIHLDETWLWSVSLLSCFIHMNPNYVSSENWWGRKGLSQHKWLRVPHRVFWVRDIKRWLLCLCVMILVNLRGSW